LDGHLAESFCHCPFRQDARPEASYCGHGGSEAAQFWNFAEEIKGFSGEKRKSRIAGQKERIKKASEAATYRRQG
jgi:hypothetical protein